MTNTHRPGLRQVALLTIGSHNVKVFSGIVLAVALGAALVPAPSQGAVSEAQRSVPVVKGSCAEFAIAHATGTWMCNVDNLTDIAADGSATVTDLASGRTTVVANAASPTLQEQRSIEANTTEAAAPTEAGIAAALDAVIDEYHARRSTTFYYGTNGSLKGSVRFEHYVILYNHSAADTQTVKFSQTGSDLYWTLRIRRDNNLSGDDTVFTYQDGTSCQAGGGIATCSAYEGPYGEGYNRFPYDGKKYFLDAFNWSLYAGGTHYANIGGSAQSDRATCYKTVSCKFKG